MCCRVSELACMSCSRRMSCTLFVFGGRQGSRHVVFGSYNRIGRNVGVLLTWCMVITANGVRRWLSCRRQLRLLGRL